MTFQSSFSEHMRRVHRINEREEAMLASPCLTEAERERIRVMSKKNFEDMKERQRRQHEAIERQCWAEDQRYFREIDKQLKQKEREVMGIGKDLEAQAHEQTRRTTLGEELQSVINRNSVENGSNTPDFILARFLVMVLGAFDEVVNARERWYGRDDGVKCDSESKPEPEKRCCGTNEACSTPGCDGTKGAFQGTSGDYSIQGTFQAFAGSERELSHEERASRETGRPLQTLHPSCYSGSPVARVMKKPTVNPNMEFTSLTDEKYREYVFATPHGDRTVIINNPQALNVSKSGGHRVLDQNGVSHYIPAGWIHLRWETNTDYGFLY